MGHLSRLVTTGDLSCDVGQGQNIGMLGWMLRGQGRAAATRRFRESPQYCLASFSALVCSVSGLGWFELQRQGMLPVSGEVTVSMTGNCSFQGSQPLSLPCLASIPRGRPPPGAWAPLRLSRGAPTAAASRASFRLAVLRCEGHRTEIVGRPG